MYFINELKYSKRSERGTKDAIFLFWLLQKLSDRTLLSYELLLPCDETSTLYSLPTFFFMFIAPLRWLPRVFTNNPSYEAYVTEANLVTLSLRFCSRDSPLRLPI